jgi:AraC-like DNA-binding protein
MILPPFYAEHQLLPDRRVEAVWSFVGDADQEHLVLPDGRCDIILKFRKHASGVLTQVVPMLAGPSTLPFRVAIYPGLGFVGIRMRPGYARAYLGNDLTTLRNRVLEGRAAIDRLPALKDVAAKAMSIEHVINGLTGLVGEFRPDNDLLPNQRMVSVLERLHLGRGRMRMAEIAEIEQVDVRTIHREITLITGIPPKTFSRILQFHRALGLLRSGLSASAAAHEAGYADQAHMTRSFRRFGGFTPDHLADRPLAQLPI